MRVRVVRQQRSVCADFSGNRAYLGMVEHAVADLGAERLVFGFEADRRAFSRQIAKVVAAEIGVDDKRRIL